MKIYYTGVSLHQNIINTNKDDYLKMDVYGVSKISMSQLDVRFNFITHVCSVQVCVEMLIIRLKCPIPECLNKKGNGWTRRGTGDSPCP